MKFYSPLLFLLLISRVTVAQPVDMIEHRLWDKTPIHIVLPVGKERRIDFPIAIQLQVPVEVKSKSKRLQVTESGSVYWVAKEPFKVQRVNAITETGYSYILDIEARKTGHRHPISILDDRIPSETNNNQSADQAQYDYDYVDLARFAAQSVYAPERLVKKLPGVRRVELEPGEYPLVRGGDLITEPMAQWAAATRPTLYVTAVRITSNSLQRTILDPRLLRGDFLAASAQHAFVNPAGEDGDTTTWYLISNQPFNEVMP